MDIVNKQGFIVAEVMNDDCLFEYLDVDMPHDVGERFGISVWTRHPLVLRVPPGFSGPPRELKQISSMTSISMK